MKLLPIPLFLALAGLLCLLLACSGCISDSARSDIHDSALASYNAAASLPATPQQMAIEANQLAICSAVGLPFTPAQSATAPAVAP